MFKGLFGGKRKKSKGKKADKSNVKGKQQKKEEEKAPIPPKAQLEKSSLESKKVDVNEGKESVGQVSLRQRKKKGKKPKFKKIERPKKVRDIGHVKKAGDKFFPGDVDFSYTSPRENWVSCFGQKNDLDLGHQIRILPDAAEDL